ncbi:MAG: type II toxin-antitoxin system VapC family toxin [Spirochaetia bacterium]
MTYLLDTSIYSQAIKKNPVYSVVEKWKEVGDASCCISVFCEMEILQGLRMSGSKTLYHMYEHVLKDRITLIPFTLAEAEIYAQLQAESVHRGYKRPVIDLCIAATAISHGCTLVTLNNKDFDGIPNLIIEDWCSI